MKSYLITDPEHYGHTPESVDAATRDALRRYRPDYACFRDKSAADYPALAAAFLAAGREAGGTVLLLHGDVSLAAELGADGVHLPASAHAAVAAARASGLYVVASCHSLSELETVRDAGADAATYSPVFASPGKGNPKGLEDLKEIMGKIDLNLFALGGIVTPEDAARVAATGVYGFASIRYFTGRDS